MNFTHESIEQRRTQLAAQIARQRHELASAYRSLEKPIHYAEYGLRGFGFLRKNPWVLTVLPAAFSIGSTLFGMRKLAAQKPKLRERIRPERLERKPKGLVGHVSKLGGYGWQLFRLYRRVRPYFM